MVKQKAFALKSGIIAAKPVPGSNYSVTWYEEGYSISAASCTNSSRSSWAGYRCSYFSIASHLSCGNLAHLRPYSFLKFGSIKRNFNLFQVRHVASEVVIQGIYCFLYVAECFFRACIRIGSCHGGLSFFSLRKRDRYNTIIISCNRYFADWRKILVVSLGVGSVVQMSLHIIPRV